MSRERPPREQVLERLADLAAQGVDGLGPRRPARAWRDQGPRPASKAPAGVPPPPLEACATQASLLEPASQGLEGMDLPALAQRAAGCTQCALASGRTQVVFGTGSPSARLMFIGEAPGREEDLQGEPFVGRAGQLLTDMIEKGMRLRRGDVYIANVIKCRPPENRDPEPDEIAACEGFLRRQVELVRPEVIVALGRVAAQALLRTTTRIGQLRGRWHEYQGIPLLPTFHPAYLLRNPADKRLAWDDLQQVMRKLGL